MAEQKKDLCNEGGEFTGLSPEEFKKELAKLEKEASLDKKIQRISCASVLISDMVEGGEE